MGIDELKDSVSGIRMNEEMRRAVIENVKERTGRSVERQTEHDGKTTAKAGKAVRRVQRTRKTRRYGQRNRHPAGWQKHLAAAALVIVVIGAAAVPVRAFVNSVIKERMEEMPQEEKDAYVKTVKEQKTEADGFTREYTESEQARYQELAGKYQEGTFPDKAVVQADSEEEAAGYEFCYLKPTSTFCLPERELTDEELLQIIDFIAKREYSYREDYAREHAEEIAREEEAEKAAIAENVEGGGITEQQAIEIATQKLSEIFGMTGDGFERNSYYDEREEGEKKIYCVNWSNIISHQHYYFYIDAADGHMTWAEHSGEEIREAPSAALEEVEEKIPELQAAATSCMKDIVKESYNKVYVYYLKYPDGSAGNSVRFYFVREGQNACAVTYTWNGILRGIEEKDISGLEDGAERELWNGEEHIKTSVVFQELDA